MLTKGMFLSEYTCFFIIHCVALTRTNHSSVQGRQQLGGGTAAAWRWQRSAVVALSPTVTAAWQWRGSSSLAVAGWRRQLGGGRLAVAAWRRQLCGCSLAVAAWWWQLGLEVARRQRQLGGESLAAAAQRGGGAQHDGSSSLVVARQSSFAVAG